MISDKVVDLVVEISENLRRRGDKSGLVAVAASEVLGGYDRNGSTVLSLYEKYLAVIIGKIRALNNLGDERPKFERLVRRLMVENEVDAADALSLADEEQSSQELLGD